MFTHLEQRRKGRCLDSLPHNIRTSMPDMLASDRNLRRCGKSKSYIRFSEREKINYREDGEKSGFPCYWRPLTKSAYRLKIFEYYEWDPRDHLANRWNRAHFLFSVKQSWIKDPLPYYTLVRCGRKIVSWNGAWAIEFYLSKPRVWWFVIYPDDSASLW